jgi:hypothetical protein
MDQPSAIATTSKAMPEAFPKTATSHCQLAPARLRTHFGGYRIGSSLTNGRWAVVNRSVSERQTEPNSRVVTAFTVFYFQSLPGMKIALRRPAAPWHVGCITQKRMEGAMKTKTNVKAGSLRMIQ